MEKEMKTEFKIGDRVVTPIDELGVVSDFTSLGTVVIVKIRRTWHALGVFDETTWNQLWKPDKLRHANIYDEAGERWRLSCTMKRLTGVVNGTYTGPVAPLRHRELWTKEVVDRFEEYCGSRSDKLTSEMEEKLNETESELRVGDIVENHIGERGRVVKISKRVFVYVKMITGARASRTLCFGKKGLVKLAPKEKEMEPKFKVGDIVKTPTGEFATVVPFESDSIDDITQVKTLDGTEVVFLTRHLKETHLKDGAAAYAKEGYKAPEDNICYSAQRMGAMEKAVREAYQEPPQPIFRMKKKDGTSGWEGCYFVLVAEDEHDLLVKEVDINEAKVRDRVVTVQKNLWTRDYSIGDEIINFLSARGGNFTNKVVDNG